MTARPLPNLMYHIFVQKHSLSGLEPDTFFQCLKFCVAFKDINKLKVFMPMQNLKARIARDTFFVRVHPAQDRETLCPHSG